MDSNELKNIFIAETLEQHSELEQLFVSLEKNPTNKSTIEAIFRITHTLKANASAMDLEGIAQIAHLLEDIFSIFKKDTSRLENKLFNDLLRTNDKLLELVKNIDNDKKISYKGLITRLKVILRDIQVKKDEDKKEEQKELILEENSKESNKNSLIQEDYEAQFEQEIETKEVISETIAIPVQKLDNLLNLVSELSIERDRIMTIIPEKKQLKKNEFSHLYRITADLQHSVMNARLVQVGLLFQKLPRIVRDIEQLEKKEVELKLKGKNIEIDRNILHIILDSVVHLVRNAISHGIETPEERQKKGKKTKGKLTIRASNDKEQVVLEVQDDGKGIDANIIRQKVIEKQLLSTDLAHKISDDDIIQFIFESGFSSAKEISKISGRGVGLDVVKKAIDSIGGKVAINTQINKGTTFCLSLPASMVIKPALVFELNKQVFAVHLSSTEAVIAVSKSDLRPAGQSIVLNYQEKIIPVIFLKDVFQYTSPDLNGLTDWKSQYLNLKHTFNKLDESEQCSLIILSDGLKHFAFVVDKILNQKEIVEKKLKKPLNQLLFFNTATILGDGSVCLILNISSLIDFLFKNIQILR